MKKRVLPLLFLVLLFAFAVPVQAASITDLSDVKSSDWHYAAVAFAVDNSLFNGTSDTTFSPNAAMTRGMLVTVLGRSAKVDTSAYMLENFADVQLTDYYAPYVQWAYVNGIVSGTGGGSFSPNANVTREQIAKILYGYCSFAGCDMEYGSSKYSAFSDNSSVSDYAETALKWATYNDIIKGSNGMLNPQTSATRAEVAMIFMNAQKILNHESSNPENGEENPIDPIYNNDEIADHPTGTSVADANGGYWDYDMARAIYDATNDVRKENGFDPIGYSLVLQDWANQRALESYLINYDQNEWGSPHHRPNGDRYDTIGTGCTAENAVMASDYHKDIFYENGIAMKPWSETTEIEDGLGISNHFNLSLNEWYPYGGKATAEVWYNSSGHRYSMLKPAESTAVGVYICDGEMHIVQLYNGIPAAGLQRYAEQHG